MDGQRVVRVVLEDHQRATGLQDPVRLSEQTRVLRVGDVVQHTSEKHDIETGVLERHAFAAEVNELRLIPKTGATHLQAPT